MMIVVANLRLSGFFRVITHWIAAYIRRPITLLAMVIFSSGVLSAFRNQSYVELSRRAICRTILLPWLSESVREHQVGLQSFRSMSRIEARRKKASALRLRFSQSFASLRQRLSQAMVRSTIQRLGNTANPLT